MSQCTRTSARQRWAFFTHYDLSTIKSKDQLRAMVKGRSSISDAQALSDVEAWMMDKQF